MAGKVYVVGVGMTKFEKPGRREGWDYPHMAREAGTNALADAGHRLRRGRAGLRRLLLRRVHLRPARALRARPDRHPDLQRQQQLLDGLDGAVPRRAGRSAAASPTACSPWASRRCSPARWRPRYDDRDAADGQAHPGSCRDLLTCAFPPAPQMFGAAGREHMEKYGTTAEHFAKIGYKNHKHSVNNPYAQFQDEYTLEDILAAQMIYDPLTKLQCSPTSDGSGAAILAQRGVRRQARPGRSGRRDRRAGDDHRPRRHLRRQSCQDSSATHMTRQPPNRSTSQSGLGPEDVHVIELHDCFSANELCSTRPWASAPRARRAKLIDDDDTTYGGRWVVNPSGGLISKGHPLGATGLAQCAELTWQLRGDGRQAAGRRRDCRTAAQHRAGRRGGRHRLPARRKELGMGVLNEVGTIETDGLWLIDDIAARPPS